MKAFKFRLETLLHLRELAKDKAISEYGKSIRIREEAENNLFAKEQELVGLRKEIGLRRSSGFSGSEQENYNRSIVRAKEAIINCNSKVQDAISMETAKRKLYLQADSEYKSLLKLKDNQRIEHLEIETKKEEMELESIIGSRFVFNHSSNF